jgi:hypothetical protein
MQAFLSGNHWDFAQRRQGAMYFLAPLRLCAKINCAKLRPGKPNPRDISAVAAYWPPHHSR